MKEAVVLLKAGPEDDIFTEIGDCYAFGAEVTVRPPKLSS
jgi:hypothetical protein